jgi:hypothetical protein
MSTTTATNSSTLGTPSETHGCPGIFDFCARASIDTLSFANFSSSAFPVLLQLDVARCKPSRTVVRTVCFCERVSMTEFFGDVGCTQDCVRNRSPTSCVRGRESRMCTAGELRSPVFTPKLVGRLAQHAHVEDVIADLGYRRRQC